MRWLALFLLITVGAVLMGSEHISWAGDETSSLRTFALPKDSMFFQAGPGQEVANTYCLICHSADYIYTQPLHSQEQWHSIITKMRRVFGCPIPEDQIPALATYLFQQNSFSTLPPTDSR